MARNNGCLSNSTHMYWDYRDVLSELNGIILKGVILTSMRKEMLERTHQGKAWGEFWNSGKISICSICQQHQTQIAKANDSLPVTKQALGKGSNIPLHLG